MVETGAADAADARMRRRAAESQRDADDGGSREAQSMQESMAADDTGAIDESYLRQAQLDRIRALRDTGRTTQARDELDAFLARWPGYPLPEDLQPLRR
jgi:outer membrane protein assembly factor BamD (BamD/ComL family)